MSSNNPLCKNFIKVCSKNKKISGIRNCRNPMTTKIYQSPMSSTSKSKFIDHTRCKKNKTFLLQLDKETMNKNPL